MISFWKANEKNGYMCQWYTSNFELTNEIVNDFPDEIKELKLCKNKSYVLNDLISRKKYDTAEKFMMMGKASLFLDKEMIGIMADEYDPKTLKALGQKVKDFNQSRWNTYKLDIVKIGNYLKFSQNENLKKKLLETGTNELVEASPLDNIWGIGLSADHKDILDKTKWKGKNLLGEAIMFSRGLL
jgi:ribA/ribD-fused uncharacterized protein